MRYNSAMRTDRIDRLFLVVSVALIAIGFFIFLSAAFGVLARSEAKFENVILSQALLGLGGGTAALILLSRIKLIHLKKNAFWIFTGGILLSALVFVPGVGFEHGGARRWIDLGFTTFQPSEFLKFGFVVYLAAWFTYFRGKIHRDLFGFYPLLGLLGITGALILSQPDTGTFLIAAAAGVGMYLVMGGKWHHFLLIAIAGILLLVVLAFTKPYIMDRFMTLFRPDDFQGSGYQIKQSLIAIGSGEITGKGWGQSVQKFNYLPEPIGDSVFAVYAEELGFIGAVFLILLYVLFALRGLWIASHSADLFSGLLAVGLVILITAQSFVNIGSMLGLAPLTGVPLVFVSHGGTALFIALAEVGILFNISRHCSRI